MRMKRPFLTCLKAVSYTQLDVYKRQRAYRAALAALDRFAPEKKGMFRKRQGVSDVYKRQV